MPTTLTRGREMDVDIFFPKTARRVTLDELSAIQHLGGVIVRRFLDHEGEIFDIHFSAIFNERNRHAALPINNIFIGGNGWKKLELDPNTDDQVAFPNTKFITRDTRYVTDPNYFDK